MTLLDLLSKAFLLNHEGNEYLLPYVYPILEKKKYKDVSKRQRVNILVSNTHYAKVYELITEVKILLAIVIILIIQSGHNFHMSWQLSCHDMCKTVTWSNDYFSSKHNMKFWRDLD